LRIRLASAADRPALNLFFAAALEERDYADLFGGPIDWATVQFTDQVVILIAEDPELIGCFVAVIVKHPIGGRVYGDQVLWYVTPARRTSSAGLLLWHAYEEWCLTHGVTQVRVVQPADRPRLGAHFARRGYRAIEIGWVRDLTGDG